MNRTSPLRIALVGLGPKGLFALERLLDRMARIDAPRPIEIDAFDPHSTPGAGPVYDPKQPAYLRMNFSAEQITLWPAGSRAVPEAEQLSFADWRAGAESEGAYAPRAEVGRYLADGLAALLEHCPPQARIVVHEAAVTAIRPRGSRWEIATPQGGHLYDEVLVATGHAATWNGALARDWPHPAQLIEGVFPVETRLGTERIQAGRRVAVRGYALTFIDAALALTEGRGGSFETLGAPGRLSYRRCGAEPAKVFPFSRTGRPMLAKPDPDSEARDERRLSAEADARERILALPDGFGVAADLVPVVQALATEAGDADLEPARGAAWRAVYPAVVERLGGDGLADPEWPAFLVLAAEMERIAFGPPPLNAAKMVALVEAGIVDPLHASGATVVSTERRTALRSAAGEDPVEVVVDGVLPPPGVIGVDNPLPRQMLDDGLARVRPGRRGIEVAADATCIGAAGDRTAGLAAHGRPTEDSVIGNDTLSRKLHPQLDRWAERVTSRLAREPEPAIGATIP